MASLFSGDLVACRYRIVRSFGEGGMGTAFLARDMVAAGGEDGDEVALKLMHVASGAIDAFRREFTLLRATWHPHLARVRDFGWHHADQAYYTADVVDGVPLDAFATGQPWAKVAGALCDALDALGALHDGGIAHGDFKPDNVLVDAAGRGVLIDLSCSRRLGAPPRAIGTPGYAAPEVVAGEAADHRADLFGVGVTIERASERAKKAPKSIARLVRRLCSVDPKKRPADVAEVIAALGGRTRARNSRVEEPRLYGRGREVSAFEAALQSMTDGGRGPRVVMVSGVGGVGRSALLRELKWIAQLSLDVVEAHPAQSEPVSEMVRRATGDVNEDAWDALDALPRRERPVVLLVDDAHLLPGPQRQLLTALARASHAEARHMLVVAADAPLELGVAELSSLELEPLGETPLAEWVADAVGADRVAEVLELTGGFPSAVVQLLAAQARDAHAMADLSRLANKSQVSEVRVALVREMAASARIALATLAALERPLEREALAYFSIDEAALNELAGWVTRDDRGWRLMRASDAKTVLAALSDEERVALHERAAEWLSRCGEDAAPRRAEQLLRAGKIDEAGALFDEHADAGSADAWAEVAAQLAKLWPTEPVALAAAEILGRAGRADDALSVLARAMRLARGGSATLFKLVGAAYLRAGRHERALRYLRRALSGDDLGSQRASTMDLLSRALLKHGAYSEAMEVALEALGMVEDDEALNADLHDDVGVAASYLGDSNAAREHLEAAARLHRAAGRSRAQARSASYRALVAYRDGDTRAAARGFQEAMELAEQAAAADLMLYAAQNLGTAFHQLGDLGRALTIYDRGLSMAIALGDVSAEAALRCNLAKLHADLGLLDRAREESRRAEQQAKDAGLSIVAATAASTAGEAMLHAGDPEGAIASFRRARATFGSSASRELAETDIHLADALSQAGDEAAASRARERAERAVGELHADDLGAKLALSRARVHVARGDGRGAMAELDRALELAERAGQRELEAEVRAALAHACRAQGAAMLAERHARAAREQWEETATSLPAHLAESFWAHPARRLPSVEALTASTDVVTSRRTERLERLLSINKRLSSSLDTEHILALTIDSALELTGAERGFVILRKPDDALEVAVARNLDASGDAPNLLFSQSIAQRVIGSAEPVITVDAQQDARFEAQKSIHTMQLKSVVSVPIIATAGVIGAVYLDHRFKRGIFGTEQVELLSAFADQVAIALTNARLHQELAQRTAQLDALLRDQSERIVDLTKRVAAQKEVLEHRYDYREIVGESPAMQAVFRTLDRVIPSDVPVLVQGESGTGKELIAKAIHFNGPRKDGPLTSINCGAVPETLLESELFGYHRGAFTGASEDRDGLFVTARGGTLFLDELGEMPPSMQVKLLRVLQEREVRPLGSSQTIPIDVRIVAATNKLLADEVAAGRFRQDLYYRIGVVEVTIPPLRERIEDLPALVDRILDRAAEHTRQPKPDVAKAALRRLVDYPFPGNVRELENVLTKALLLADDGIITPDALGLGRLRGLGGPGTTQPRTRREHHGEEAKRLLAMLRATGWNISETARKLGLSRPTVYRRMRKHGFEAAEG